MQNITRIVLQKELKRVDSYRDRILQALAEDGWENVVKELGNKPEFAPIPIQAPIHTGKKRTSTKHGKQRTGVSKAILEYLKKNDVKKASEIAEGIKSLFPYARKEKLKGSVAGLVNHLCHDDKLERTEINKIYHYSIKKQ